MENITSLCKNNVLIADPQDILQEECEYFQSLYSNCEKLELSSASEEYFPSHNVCKLSHLQQFSCEGEITEQELLEANNSFSAGKLLVLT